MGFGSVGSRQSIRDFRHKMAQRKNKYKKASKTTDNGKIEEDYNHLVLKPEVVKEIRERLQKERKQRIKWQLILFVITLVLLLGLLLF
jgi:rRNA maturation endonuclease Nob1